MPTLINKCSSQLTRSTCRRSRSTWPPSRSRQSSWTRLFRRFRSRTNLSWRRSRKAGQAEPDPQQAAEKRKTRRTRTKMVPPPLQPHPEVPDTPPTHQNPRVTAIIDTGPELGTVSNPSHALGRTRHRPGHEGQADLEEEIQLQNVTTTLCFRV